MPKEYDTLPEGFQVQATAELPEGFVVQAPRPMAPGARYDVTNATSPIEPGSTREGAAAAVRYSPVVAAAMIPNPTTPAAMTTLFGLGATADMAANQLQGKNPFLKPSLIQSGRAGVDMAIPGAQVNKASGVFNAALQTGTAAVRNAVAGDIIEQASSGEWPSFNQMAEPEKRVLTLTTLGMGSGGLGFGAKLVSTLAENAAAREARKELLNYLGKKRPSLSESYFGLTNFDEATQAMNPAAKARGEQSKFATTKQLFTLAGENPTSAEYQTVKDSLQSRIPQVDELAGKLDAAEKAKLAANEALAKAEEAAKIGGIRPLELERMRQQATAAQMNAINAQASALFESGANLGGFVSPKTMAADLRTLIEGVHDVRKGISKQLYDAAGIPAGIPLYNKQEMAAVAAEAMSEGFAGTTQGKKLLETILSASDDGALTDMQLRTLRNSMQDAFVEKGKATQGQVSAEVNRIYEALKNRRYAVIQGLYGEDKLNALKAADAYNAKTSQVIHSPFGTALLNKSDITDEAVAGLANKIASGKTQELDNFKAYVDLIRESNPAVANYAMATMAKTLRSTFLSQAYNNGSFDAGKLVNNLIDASRRDRLPFPVQTLGFGDIPTLRQWQSTLKEFKPGEVTESIVSGLMDNPKVQDVILRGGSDAGKILGQETARGLFNQRVREQVLLEASNKLAPARKAAQEAAAFAQKAGIDADAAKTAYATAVNDPITGAFAGRGTLKLSDVANEQGTTISKMLLDMHPDTAKNLMTALREREPTMADIIERRVMNTMLDKFRTEVGGKPGVMATDKIAAYFHPPVGSPNFELERMKSVLGSSRIGEMEKFVTTLSKFEEDLAAHRSPTLKTVNELAAISGGTTAARAGLSPGYPVAFARMIHQMFTSKLHAPLTWALVDKDAGGALFNYALGIKPVADSLASLPAQKMYLMMADRPFSEQIAQVAKQNP